MSTPIRISYLLDADYFIEAQRQSPPALSSPDRERKIRFFMVFVVVGALLFAFGEQHQQGMPLKVCVLGLIFALLVMGFWLWFFKKIGWYKKQSASEYQWTEKAVARLKKSLEKRQFDKMPLVCVFDEKGFQFQQPAGKIEKHEWSAISRAVERPQGLCVFKNNLTFFWFQKKAFETTASYRELIEIMRPRVANFQELGNQGMTIIALGSNLGDSRELFLAAMTRLQEFSDVPILKSSLWQTTPVDCPPGSPPFVNAVVGLLPRKDETPESLLGKLQALEKESGRTPKKVLNEPRPLDLDLIAFGAETRNSPTLILPHPRAAERRFVLQPLSEIAPELVLPGQGKTAAELLAALPNDEAVTKLA